MANADPAIALCLKDAMISHQQSARVNGVNLNYAVAGQGDPVLLWHGFPGTSQSWHKVVPLLARTHTVIVPDMRGFGDSDKPARGYDAHTLVGDFRELLRHLDIGPLHIVAHDMGAPAALVWAGHHPDEVRTLAYLDEPIITGESLARLMQFTPEGTARGGLWWWPLAFAPGLAETLFSGHEREVLSWFYDNYCANPGAVSQAAFDETMRTFAAPGGVSGVLGVYRAIFETQAQTERFTRDKVQVPVLALGGDASFGDKTRELLTTVAENVQGGVVAHCGHFIPEEQPEELVRRLSAFWAGAADR
jgi:pimeloyl-ACP methyl ester carboxylesterase